MRSSIILFFSLNAWSCVFFIILSWFFLSDASLCNSLSFCFNFSFSLETLNRACWLWSCLLVYWKFPMMLPSHTVNSDMLFITHSKELWADWLIWEMITIIWLCCISICWQVNRQMILWNSTVAYLYAHFTIYVMEDLILTALNVPYVVVYLSHCRYVLTCVSVPDIWLQLSSQYRGLHSHHHWMMLHSEEHFHEFHL